MVQSTVDARQVRAEGMACADRKRSRSPARAWTASTRAALSRCGREVHIRHQDRRQAILRAPDMEKAIRARPAWRQFSSARRRGRHLIGALDYPGEGGVEVNEIARGISGFTVTVCCAWGAAWYVVLSAWFASMTQRPGLVKVTVEPVIEHTGPLAESMLRMTGSADPQPEALTV